MARALFAVFAALLLAAPALAGDDWWDLDWHYRVRADVNASSYDREDWIVEQPLDFSEVLGSLADGKRLDPNSIRVIDYSDGRIGEEEVSQFDRDSPDSWGGELLWRMSGSIYRNHNRTYYIYFDVLENGEKPAPGYASGVVVESREKDIRIDSSDFMLFLDRTQYGYTHVSKKQYPWQDVPTPPADDPLANARENVSRFRGTISLFGDHYCDPGCERSASRNLSDEVIHQGPLRAALISYVSSIDRDSDNSSIPFEGWQTTYVYADKPYYRTHKTYRFDEFPQNLSGLNHRTWILSGRQMQYAYEASDGEVREGSFPAGGMEYRDWNGTWDDSLGSDDEGIADFEMLPLSAPHSLWIEQDTNTPVSYISALWRPERAVGERLDSDYIFYFHNGDWREADLPMRYWELRSPPVIGVGNLSDFSLSLLIPGVVLNWDPTVSVGREVRGNNITIERMDCRMYSEDRKLTLFEGPVGEAGLSVFDVPDGRWSVTCVAYDQHGHAATDTKYTQVYDVMTLMKICGASLLLLFLLAAVLAIRISRSTRKKGRTVDCPRCGMPLEEGARECPVCGRKLY